MNSTFRFLWVLVLAVTSLGSLFQPQTAPPARLVSPEVHPDQSVTFRFRAPNAKEVLLGLEGSKPVPMEKDDQGVWSRTTTAMRSSPTAWG